MKRFAVLFLAMLMLSVLALTPVYAKGGSKDDHRSSDFSTEMKSQHAPLDNDGDVEFDGYIESKSNEYWTISGRTVLVDDNTRIDEEHGPAEIGAFVEVKAVQRNDGSLYAKKIKVKEADHTPEPTRTHTPEPTHTPESTRTPHPTRTHTPEPTHTPESTHTPEPTRTPQHDQKMEFRGVIESQDGSQWTISGTTVTVDQNTRIDERDGQAVVGATVDVMAITQADGSLWAKKIEVKDMSDGDHDHGVEFKGAIEAKNRNMWTIGGRQVMVDANTQIDEQNGPANVGAYVEVKARRNDDGSLYANKISVESRHDDGELPRIEWQGAIESMTGSVWTIGGRNVLVDARTRFNTDHGPVEMGAFVEVKARQQADGVLWAERIATQRQDGSENEVQLRGRIESMASNMWTIGGFQMGVDANTVIDEREGPARVGTYAEAKAVRQADGSLYARRIHILDDVPDGYKVEFRGPIEVMSADMWQVAGFDVQVDEGTRFENLERAALGVTAEVKARRMDDGSLLAIEIEVKGDEMMQQREAEWKGRLERFNSARWTVSGRTVMLDQNTMIIGQPVIGATVEVHAREQADGGMLAIRLKVQNSNEVMAFKGFVESISPNAWVISGRTVMVDGRTVFDERHGPLGVGVYVEVKAMHQSDGSLLALRIKSED